MECAAAYEEKLLIGVYEKVVVIGLELLPNTPLNRVQKLCQFP